MAEEPGERRSRVKRALEAVSQAPTSLPLATGDLSDEDAEQLRALKTLIASRVGLNCDGYKERCLRRRIAVRMRARGIHRYNDYGALLESDETEYQRLLDTVMINVSKFFRNNDVYDRIRDMIVPWLFDLNAPRVRIWSAGCAGGEEPYSLAMMLLEHAEPRGVDPARFEILATDVDQGAMAIARRAEYGAFSLTETPEAARDRWFDPLGGGIYRVRPEVRALVRFDTLDLLADETPTDVHLILCRNVIIYFERDMQERLFRRFNAALAPGGFLVLGKVEALFGASATGYRSIANRERIFRKA